MIVRALWAGCASLWLKECCVEACLGIVLLVHCVEPVLLLNLFALTCSSLGLTNIYPPLKGALCSSEKC